MSRPHYTVAALPSGEKELTLAPIGSGTERVIYSLMVVGMLGGGFLVLPHPMGWALLGVGLLSAVVLYRTTQRKERWIVSRGSATRIVSGFGKSQETYAPVRVLATPRTDDDQRRVVELQLEHQGGKVRIGTHELDDDERAAALASAMAEAIGVEVKRG